MAVNLANALLIKVLKKPVFKDMWYLPESSNMKVWEMQAASGNYLSLLNSLRSDGLTTCFFSLCLSKDRVRPPRH